MLPVCKRLRRRSAVTAFRRQEPIAFPDLTLSHTLDIIFTRHVADHCCAEGPLSERGRAPNVGHSSARDRNVLTWNSPLYSHHRPGHPAIPLLLSLAPATQSTLYASHTPLRYSGPALAAILLHDLLLLSAIKDHHTITLTTQTPCLPPPPSSSTRRRGLITLLHKRSQKRL